MKTMFSQLLIISKNVILHKIIAQSKFVRKYSSLPCKNFLFHNPKDF